MLVHEIMITEFPVCTPEQSIQKTLELFSKIDSHIIPVVDDSLKLIALITRNKIIQALAKGATINQSIRPLLTKEPVTLSSGLDIYEARTLLLEYAIGHAPVVNDISEPVGILTTSRILAAYDLVYDSMESQLSMLFENMDFGIFSVDTNLKITAVNRMAEVIFDMSSEETKAMNELEGLEEIAGLLSESLQNNKPSLKKKIRFNEKSLYIQCHPLKQKGELVGSMVITDDWTNFEKVVNELRFSKEWEEKLRSVVELAYDGFILVNESAEITMINKGFIDLYSVKEEEVLKRDVLELFSELGFSEVLSSGVRISNAAKLINDTQCLITTLPIKNNEEIIGAICKITYRGLKQLQEALSKVSNLEEQLNYYQKELGELKGTKYSFGDIAGESKIIRRVKSEAVAASRTTSTVLLLGESGTGKELFAHGIHVASPQTGKFVQVNCSAIPKELMESEFFGYAEGSFTGAKKGGKKGKFEMAQNGTVFLDEIGDMPLALQSKLLRVLQEREFEPIGSNRIIKLQTKIVAATNQNLEELIRKGKFREDLYYRLNVMRIEIPALRERIEDLPDIVDSIIYKLRQNGFYLEGITHAALSKLIHHNWPGNIRELHNIIERAANLTEDGYVDLEQLPETLAIQKDIETDLGSSSLLLTEKNQPVEEMTEKETIEAALKKAKGNKAKASRELGISRTWLYKKIKEYQIEEI